MFSSWKSVVQTQNSYRFNDSTSYGVVRASSVNSQRTELVDWRRRTRRGIDWLLGDCHVGIAVRLYSVSLLPRGS